MLLYICSPLIAGGNKKKSNVRKNPSILIYRAMVMNYSRELNKQHTDIKKIHNSASLSPKTLLYQIGIDLKNTSSKSNVVFKDIIMNK